MPTTQYKHPAIQERRTGAIDAYYGPVDPLIEGIKSGQLGQRIRTFSQTKPDEITAVLTLLHQIQGTVTVVHGARGCSAIQHFLEAYDGKGSPVVTTNLNEDNSIMGAEDKLRAAIERSTTIHKPTAIFVVTSPIVAINNDDVRTSITDLSEKLDIPIIPIYTDGFKSKTAGNGYDIGLHALAHFLVPEATETDAELVNIITPIESKDDVSYFEEIVSVLKIKANIFPRYADAGAFNKASVASISISSRSEGRVLGEFLETERAIPYIQLLPPIGIGGTSRWMRAVAEKTGRPAEVEALIQSREHVGRGLSLGGKKIYISGEAVVALGLAQLVDEAGGKVAGLSLSSLDRNTAVVLEESYKKHNWEFPVHIGDGQMFEQINILSRVKPDVYLGEWGQAAQTARAGIPSLNYNSLPLYGYDAAVRIIKKINRAWQGREFAGKHTAFSPPYSGSWLIKNPNWYIKQEVG